MSKPDESTLTGCAVICGGLILIWIAVTWGFTIAWNYVAVGVFGLPELTFWHSAAIIFLLGFLKSSVSMSRKED